MTNLIINNKKYQFELQGHETLLEVLRDHLGLTGTKTACDEAECGACTVIMDGKAILACITLATEAEGKTVTTIEGLANGDELHPIQQSFLDNAAVQCGFCMPGMIMASKALLDENPAPSEPEIARALEGNICRCAGYPKIMDAVKDAVKRLNAGNGQRVKTPDTE
ncbi:MAG: (2Fe-2S)-binding protein [Candidatus Omnitrophica bacterium]|nr:(2Fe-2S)-binding protein [Candidatus Omnitrophota bacterium]